MQTNVSSRTLTLRQSFPRVLPATWLGLAGLLLALNASAVNLQKTATANMSSSSDWTLSGTGTAPTSTYFGEIGATPSSGNLSGMQLGAAVSLLGLQLDNNTAGPLTIGTTGGYSLTLAGSGINMSAANNNATISCSIITSAGQPWSVAPGETLTVSGGVTGTYGIGLYGGGTLDFNSSAAVGYTGGTVITNGTLLLDFTSMGANNNLVSSSSVLTLAGGTLEVKGNASNASSQTFASTTFAPSSGNVIYVVNNGTAPTVNLGALTVGAGSMVEILTNLSATITSGTLGAATSGVLGSAPGTSSTAGYATFGLYDWATTDTTAGAAGTTPAPIRGLSALTSGGYSANSFPGTGQGNNCDLTANYTFGSANLGVTTIRFNTCIASNVNVNGKWLVVSAVLVTPNMGSTNASINNGNFFGDYSSTVAQNFYLWQNNTSAYFTNGSGLINGRGGSGGVTSYIQGGPGTAWEGVNNTYTGSSRLNGGYTLISGDSGLGAPASAAMAYLNGGTIVGDVTMYLDNNGSGSNPRPITLMSDGGGLAAKGGTTMTVDGQIGSVAGTGPLVIGIPATAANGSSSSSRLPGSGSGTGNPTEMDCNGTVALTYASLTAGNFYFGGTTILGGATLAINSQYDLGGGNAGPLTFGAGGGTLQYTTSLATGTAGTALDVSSTTVPVTFAGNATIDVNNHAIAYANPIGNGGSGSLTVASSTAGGTLSLSGANTYGGNTTINSGAALSLLNTSGSGTGSGSTVTVNGTLEGTGITTASVTVNGTVAPGALAAGNSTIGTLTVGSLSIGSGSFKYAFSSTPANDLLVVSTSGGLTIPASTGVFNLYQAGGTSAFATPGTYNLIQYSGTPTGTGISGGALTSDWTTSSTTNPHIANPASGFAYAFGLNSGYLTVTISATANVGTWSAGGSGTWATAGNWTAIAGTMPPGSPGDSATFDNGAATGLATVTLGSTPETVGAIAMNNASSYVISGSTLTLNAGTAGQTVTVNVTGGSANDINSTVSLNGPLTATVNPGDALTIGGAIGNDTGNQSLTVAGGGTVILAVANTYGPSSGGTIGTAVTGGSTLQVQAGGALGSGDVGVTNGTLQAGTSSLTLANNLVLGSGTENLDNNGGDSVTLNGAISGPGSLNLTNIAGAGNGIVTLASGNAYTGSTTIDPGTYVSITADSALGAAPGSATANDLLFEGGDLQVNGSFTINANRGLGIGSALSVNTATTTAYIDVANGDTFTINNVIQSAGNTGVNNLTINSVLSSPGTVVLVAANTHNGTTTLGGGTLTLANANALQNSTLAYSTGTLGFGSLTTSTFGALSGSQNLTLANASSAAVALTLGNNSATATYTGILSGSGSLIENGGSPTQTIGSGTSGGVSLTGGITVDKGTLILGGMGTITGSAANLNAVGVPGNAYLTVQDAAQISTTGSIYLVNDGGAGNPATSTLTVQGSAVINANNLSIGNGSRVPGGTTVTVGGSATVNLTGQVNLLSTIGSTAQTVDLILNGGSLAATNIIQSTTGSGPNHYAQILFNGGTLKANASDPGGSQFLPAIANLVAGVEAGGAVFNPNGYTMTIAAPLTHYSGTPDGGVTVNGTSGTVVLSGVNTYTGGTTVNGATLSVGSTGVLPNTAVTVNSGGAFGGGGQVLGSVTFNAGSSAVFTEGSTLNISNALILATSGTLPVAELKLPANLGTGTYTLATNKVAGSSGTFNSTPTILSGSITSGTTATITTGGGLVQLVVAVPVPVGDVWDGGVDGNWTTAGNWSSNPTVPGNPGDAATLGLGTALTTVTLNAPESLGFLALTNANSFVIADAGNVLTLDNSGSGALVSVSGGVANAIQPAVSLNDNATVVVGAGSSLTFSGVVANNTGVTKTLTLNGPGTNILAGANSYGPSTGSLGTTLGGGILQVGNNTALGAGDVDVTVGSTLQAGASGLSVANNFINSSGVTLTANDNGNTFTLGGVISGSGSMFKPGAGTLVLSGNNTYTGNTTVTNGTLVLSGNNTSATGPTVVTNGATLQLANANAVKGSLILAGGSTVQLRGNANTSFTPASLAVQSAADTLNFDAGPVSSGSGTLTLGGTLNFSGASQVNETINVTGNNAYTLALGNITAPATTGHNPMTEIALNTLAGGAGLTLGTIQTANWSSWLDFHGGGNVTLAGNITNASNGAAVVYVTDGTTLTMLGRSSLFATATGVTDGFRYDVASGTLVVDSSYALTNNTSGAGAVPAYFVLGAVTNIYSSTSAPFSPPAGVLVNTNNSWNVAVYLGDANHLTGGLAVWATTTNYVADGDATFANSGTITIGGQNTSGINTYNNPIILGWTANHGKSVTLAAATGGEVDFAGPILKNGTDTSAGVTVGSSTFGGTVKLIAVNTYAGATTVNDGTLLVNGSTSAGSAVTVAAGAALGGTGTIGGTVSFTAGSYAQLTEGSSLTISGSLTLPSSGTLPVVKLNLPSNLAAGIYILATNAASGSSGSFNSTPVVLSGSTVAGTVPVIVTTSTAVELVVQPPLLAATLKLTQIKGLTLKVPLTSLATNWTSYYGDAISLTAISATTTNSQTVYQLNVPSLPLASSSFTAYEFLGYANTANTQNDQFTYTIADTHGNTATGTVNIIPSTAAVFGLNYATVTPGVGSATVNFAGLPGYTYEVDRATNLAPAIWVDLGNATAGSNGLFNYTDNFTDLGVTPTSAYYRLVWNH